MKWLTRAVTSSSIASIWRGAKIGSRILRYLRWRGGSTLSGMSGRTLPSSRKPSDENTSVFLNVASTARRLATMYMPGHGLHDLGLHQVLVVRLRARGVGRGSRPPASPRWSRRGRSRRSWRRDGNVLVSWVSIQMRVPGCKDGALDTDLMPSGILRRLSGSEGTS